MKKHIQTVIGILLLFASGVLFAQGSDAVKKLTQSIRSHKTMEVSFTYQTLNDASPKEEAKEGKAYFQDQAYKIILEDQQVISDGKTKWQYIVEDKEVMVGNATEEDNPYKILDELERDHSSLNPVIDAKGNLKKVEVEIDEGVRLVLNVKEMKFDQDYPKDFFSFDSKAHPDVELIDMR